jgi:hypothetical protein
MNSFPDDRSFHPEIGMYHFIPDSHHLAPGKIRVLVFQMRRDMFCRFPDDLQRSDGCKKPVFSSERNSSFEKSRENATAFSIASRISCR